MNGRTINNATELGLGLLTPEGAISPKIILPNRIWEPFTKAIAIGDMPLAMASLPEGDVNGRDDEKNTALLVVSGNGYMNLTRYLLEMGADVNAKNIWGADALMRAVMGGYLGTSRVLLDNGVDLAARQIEGATAHTLALMAGHSVIASVLKEAGAIPQGMADFIEPVKTAFEKMLKEAPSE